MLMDSLKRFMAVKKEKLKKVFSPSEEQIKIENQKKIIREEASRLENLRELILNERDNITIKKVIRSKEETDKLKKFNKVAKELGIDTERIEEKLRVTLEESWDNLRDYEVLTVIIEALDRKLEEIRSDPDKLLKEAEIRGLD